VFAVRSINGWLNKPKNADFLIDTDSELPKGDVAHVGKTPSKSSTVVIIFVLVLTFTIVGFDALVSKLVRLFL
jgi:hypothetical protein